MNVGDARERVKVLTLETPAEDFAWAVTSTVWAQVEETGARNLFSAVGLAAGTVVVTLRKRPLTLHQMLEWRGQRLFLTGIRPKERAPGWLEVTTAKVTLTPCRAEPDRMPAGGVFPGVLTEKYLRHEQGEPMATNALCYVLVTPKAVRLTPGHLVAVGVGPQGAEGAGEGGEAYAVLVAHELDPYKNEYELVRKKDL